MLGLLLFSSPAVYADFENIDKLNYEHRLTRLISRGGIMETAWKLQIAKSQFSKVVKAPDKQLNHKSSPDPIFFFNLLIRACRF